MSADIYDRYIEVCHRSNEQADEIRRLTAERDALRGEVERLRAAGAWKPEEVWREEGADEVAEQIAAFVDAEAEARREECFSYRAVSELAADIRSGSWRKESK